MKPIVKPILVGSITSPFTRRLRLLFWNRFDHEFKAINYLENKEDSAYLKSISPTNKIPVLLTGEDKIFDSRVIASQVGRMQGWAPLTIEQENALTVIDAANDTSVVLFMLRRGGLDAAKSDNFYLQRQNERILLAFDYLEPWTRALTPNKDWNFATIALYSYLAWGQFRGVLDFSKHKGLAEFLDRFSSMPGVEETKPRPV